MRVILDLLIVSVAMNCGEHGFENTKTRMHQGSNRGNGVGSTRSVRENRDGVGTIFFNNLALIDSND